MYKLHLKHFSGCCTFNDSEGGQGSPCTIEPVETESTFNAVCYVCINLCAICKKRVKLIFPSENKIT
jgi:hypothetical protein